MVLGIVVAMALLSVSILSLVSNEYFISKRAVSWSQAIFTAEAGAEYAYNEINKNTLYMNPGGSTADWFSTSNGWTTTTIGNTSIWNLASSTLTPLRTMVGTTNSTYSVSVTSLWTTNPIGQVIYVSNFTAVAQGKMPNTTMGSSQNTSRRIKLTLQPQFPFSYAMFAKGGITNKGNSSSVNSYDSSKGPYGGTNLGFSADIGSNGTITNTIDAGGLDVWGSIQVGAGGTVGTNNGFQMYSPTDGSISNDVTDGLEVNIPDAALPKNFSSTPTFSVNNGTITNGSSGTTLDVVITNTLDNYTFVGMTGTTIRLYLSNSSIDGMNGGDAINLKPFIGKVTNYTGTAYSTNTQTGTNGYYTNTSSTTNVMRTDYIPTNYFITNWTFNYNALWQKTSKPNRNVAATSSGLPAYTSAQVQSATSGEGGANGYNYTSYTSTSTSTVTTTSGFWTNGPYSTNMTVVFSNLFVATNTYTTNIVTATPSGTNIVNVTNGPPKVEIYVGGTTIDISGNGIANDGGIAANLSLYGLPSVTTVELGGNSSFYGGIYAPSAAFKLHGTADIYGSVVGNSISTVGNFNLHYDEALSKSGQIMYYKVSKWEELTAGQ